MQVQFRRSGERRYAVRVARSGLPALERDSAPGFDDQMPHDLVHFVVERELGLRQGIFGQLAAGGNAGLFLPTSTEARDRRGSARERRALLKRSEKLALAGRDDGAASEAAAAVALMAWRTHRRGGRFAAPAWIGTERLRRICEQMDVLSAQWMRLDVGDSMSVDWPESESSRANHRRQH